MTAPPIDTMRLASFTSTWRPLASRTVTAFAAAGTQTTIAGTHKAMTMRRNVIEAPHIGDIRLTW